MCFSIIFSDQRYLETHFVLLGPKAGPLSFGCMSALLLSAYRPTSSDHAGSTKINLIEKFSQLNLNNVSKGCTEPAHNVNNLAIYNPLKR